MQRTVATAAVIAAAQTSCQLGSSETGAPPAPEAPFSLQILETQACPLPAGIDPKEKRILGVKILLTGSHPGRVGANYFYGSLLTQDGDRYLAELEGCSPVLSHAPLDDGSAAEGFLNFPLPLDKTPAKIVYSPNLDHTLGSDSLSVRDLSQELPLR